MTAHDAQPGRLVTILDPARLHYRLTRGGRQPLTNVWNRPLDPAQLHKPGTVADTKHGRALVTWPSPAGPVGLWLDLAELAPALLRPRS